MKYYNKLILGDSTEVLKNMPEEMVDMVVTSPPYDSLRYYENKEAEWNFDIFKEIAQQLYRLMKPGGVMVWVVGDSTIKGGKSLTSFRQAIHFQEIGFTVFDIIIYEKTGSGPPHKNRYFNTFEYMFILSKGRPKTINLLKDKPNKWAGHETYGEITRREVDGSLTVKGKKTINEFGIRTNIWKYKNGKGQTTRDIIAHEHPAIFPEKLVEDVLKSWSNPGDIVLDPFGGSGTTAKVSKILGRKYIYIEKVEKYFKIAEERLNFLV